MARVKNPSVMPQTARGMQVQSLPSEQLKEPSQAGKLVAIFTFERDGIYGMLINAFKCVLNAIKPCFIVAAETQIGLKESNLFMVEQLSCCSDVEGVESTVEVDVEVRTGLIDNIPCRGDMANTKQTKCKQDDDGKQGTPAKFP